MLIYICEDQERDLLMLQHHLNAFAKENLLDCEIVAFSDGESLLQSYTQAGQSPVLLFLDIYMNGKNGMETARQLRDMGYAGGIIFTTASVEHAMDSYEVNALYYLQKPYDHRHFIQAMKRCESLFQQSRQHFTFMIRNREITVPYADIVFFETGRHTVILHTPSGTYSFSETLSNIVTMFHGTNAFVPVGKSYLVNLNHIIGRTDNDLLMTDGAIVQIPVKKRNVIFSLVEEWQKRK